MLRAVIWGTGREYARYLMAIRCQVLRGKLAIVGVTSDERQYKELDGYPFLPKQQLVQVAPDLVIVAVDRRYGESVTHEAELLGIGTDKLVHASVFALPNFAIESYMFLRGHPLSIVSINCWGGRTCHALNLQFRSPFINFYMQVPDFARLAQNLPAYLQQPVEFVQRYWDTKNQKHYPLMQLGDVPLYAVHYQTAAGFQEKWQERLQRFCWDNILVETVAANEQELELAEEIPYRKVCFTAFPTDAPFAIYLTGKPPAESIGFYSQKMAAGECAEQCYDPLRLLLGQQTFMRRSLT